MINKGYLRDGHPLPAPAARFCDGPGARPLQQGGRRRPAQAVRAPDRAGQGPG